MRRKETMSKDMNVTNMYVGTDSVHDEWDGTNSIPRLVSREFSAVPPLKLFREKCFDLSAMKFTVEFNSMYEDEYTDKPVPVCVVVDCIITNIPLAVDETTSYKGTHQTSSFVKNFHPVIVTNMEVIPTTQDDDYPDMYPVNNRLTFNQVSSLIYKSMFKKIDNFFVAPTVTNGYKAPIVFAFETYYVKPGFGTFMINEYIEYIDQVKEVKEWLYQINLVLTKAIKEGVELGEIRRDGKESAHFFITGRVQNVPEYLSGLYKGID